MKKTLTIIALALITCAMLVSCKDGVCDKCDKNDAIELSKERIKQLKEDGLDEYIDVDKEWCEGCLIEESFSVAGEALGEAFSELGETLGF